MRGVAEAIRSVTEAYMASLQFSCREAVDDAMYAAVRYASSTCRIDFVTDVREEEVVVRLSSLQAPLTTDVRLLAMRNLGARRRQLRPLWDKVRADDPEAVKLWLEERWPLIISLIANPRIWVEV